jgi:ATP-dependent Zn protease
MLAYGSALEVPVYAIARMIVAVEDHALSLVREHREALERLADRLLDAETLSRAEIDALLRGNGDEQQLRAASA